MSQPRADLPQAPRAAGRSLLLRWVLGAVALVAALWVALYWVEAEKEARILCALSQPGKAASEIDRMFGTANLLHVVRDSTPNGTTLHVASPRNLSRSGCTVTVAEGVVQELVTFEHFRLTPAAGMLTLVLLTAVTVYQVLLAAGAPLGRYAWGGRAAQLPARLRIASAVVAATLLLGIVSVAHTSGLLAIPAVALIAEPVIGLLTLAFVASLFANLAARSARERWAGATLALLLSCCGVVLLLGG